MKKIITTGFLMFFVHFFILMGFFAMLNDYNPKHYEGVSHPIFMIIALYCTIILYILVIILIIIEYMMKFDYKGIMLFLVYGNCFLEFYINSIYQFQLFTRPERYNISSIIIILIYFVFELLLTFYVVNRLYKSKNITA